MVIGPKEARGPVLQHERGLLSSVAAPRRDLTSGPERRGPTQRLCLVEARAGARLKRHDDSDACGRR
jgi:hypothetical protein